jgi:hypothetical protein
LRKRDFNLHYGKRKEKFIFIPFVAMRKRDFNLHYDKRKEKFIFIPFVAMRKRDFNLHYNKTQAITTLINIMTRTRILYCQVYFKPCFVILWSGMIV